MKIAVGWFTWKKLAVMAALVAVLAAIVAVTVLGCYMVLTTRGMEIDCRQVHNRPAAPAPYAAGRVKRRPASWSGLDRQRSAPVPSDALT